MINAILFLFWMWGCLLAFNYNLFNSKELEFIFKSCKLEIDYDRRYKPMDRVGTPRDGCRIKCL